MSAAEQRNGSGPSAESSDLAALRASLRCGRSLPVLHLVESDEAFAQRHPMQDVIVLCGSDVAAPDAAAEDPECPGCRDCVRYCPDCVCMAHRFSAGAPSAAGRFGDDPGHPGWCSPEHCQLTDEGELVHQGAPVRWEDSGVRFEITLVAPEDDYRTYVELQLASLTLKDAFVYAAMPVPAARRLRDELSAHLDAAAGGHRVARYWVGGEARRVMAGSDRDALAPGDDADRAP